jgi:glyoxylate utilization-related uncharacterized protein
MSFAQQTGSLVNHLYARGTKGQPEPVVGMGATFLHYTDRSAGTISKVETIKGVLYIEVQGDLSIRTDKNGFSESQVYTYIPQPDAHASRWRFKNDRWEQIYLNTETNRWKVSKNGGLRIGSRETYHDFSF